MKLSDALQQPDKARIDLEGVIITRCEMKTSSKGNTYHSSTIVDGDTKAFISFFGDYPAIQNEPVVITKAEISTYNGKRSFTAGKFSKVMKYSGTPAPAPVVTASAVSHNAGSTAAFTTSPAATPTKPSQDGPIMGMCYKLAADHIRHNNLELNTATLAKWTMFFKKTYADVCLFNPDAPAEENVPF